MPLKSEIDALRADRSQLQAIAMGTHSDPFAILGVHKTTSGERVVRCFYPKANTVHLVLSGGVKIAMHPVHDDGIFAAFLPAKKRRYWFEIEFSDGSIIPSEDPYRFGSTVDSNIPISEQLGAQQLKIQRIDGVRFSVWAPNAKRCSVVGDFNNWDGRQHVMRLHRQTGVWEIFIPAVKAGAHYKFEMLDQHNRRLPLKIDPRARLCEQPPGNAAIVFQSKHQWHDQSWMQQRRESISLESAISIYEVHLGSWKRGQNNQPLTYRQLAHELASYVVDMGFTHVELLPVTEHPFDGSWGYQATAMFAPTSRFGDADDFRYFVDYLHQAGIAVILDWVPAHFPKDEFALGRFDGTALYEHLDPRIGEHRDWGTYIYNYGRSEVRDFLIDSALFWINEFHIDALRVDAVASMLYRDYSRPEGEWVPNEHGGNENFEAVSLLREINQKIHAAGAECYAEESTAWPGVSRPLEMGGLGFTYKWNMGWMNDTLAYMHEDPVHRRHHHNGLTFGLVYAFDENFVLPLSHDEVVHGKGSLLNKMPGDDWQQFANLRAYLGFQFAHPGKKLLFMGSEIAQRKEWDHQHSLDWHLLDAPLHAQLQSLVRDLNHYYAQDSCLHQLDFDAQAFKWIDHGLNEDSVVCWLRYDREGAFTLCISHFTPVSRPHYRLGVPLAGDYQIVLNTDDEKYGGGGSQKETLLHSHNQAFQHHPQSIVIDLPPLATLFIKHIPTNV